MRHSSVVSTVSAVVIAASLAPAGEWAIGWHTTDGGGSQRARGGAVSVSGTLGQVDASGPESTMVGGRFSLVGGFWAVRLPACGAAGDFDGDSDVDLVDFARFQICYSGAGEPVAADCACGDFDGDGDADLVDFAQFQLTFTGAM